MMKHYKLIDVLHVFSVAFATNAFFLILESRWWILPAAVLFILSGITMGAMRHDIHSDRLRLAYHGCVVLIVTSATVPVTLMHYTYMMQFYLPDNHVPFVWAAVYALVLYVVLFANGVISIYVTSHQLGLKWRALGVLFAIVPVLNTYTLGRMVARVLREVEFETMRTERNLARSDDKVCGTKYPILLVHGIFMRDWGLFNYWGRIPEELETNGALIYYGEHQSALPVAESAREIAARIRWIVNKSGCEKVNIIAHSKGGLDCRYALEHLGVRDMVASLTTIGSPHRGVVFAEKLLRTVPKWIARRIENSYNRSMQFLGDKTPDFMAGVRDLTAFVSVKRDREMPLPEGVFTQSYCSKQNKPRAGRFPMNISERYCRRYDGPNDGLVGIESSVWGERFGLIEIEGHRGITHMDMIDMSREDIAGFDVREFYVGVVSDLKSRGF